MDAETNAIVAAWPLYYEQEGELQLNDKRLILIRGFAEWFRTEGATLVQHVDWESQTTIQFHYEDFKACCPYPDFAGALREEPQDLLNCLALALCVIRAERTGLTTPKILPRMLSVSPLLSMRDLKSNYVGKFVSIRGNVVRVSSIRPLVLNMAFACGKCNAEAKSFFTDGKYEPPTTCVDASCRSRTFSPIYTTATAHDWQKIRIQELEADLADAGRVPRTVEVELQDDLVDSCVPGDVVTVGGIVKAMETEVAAGRGTAKAKQVFLLYVDAASVTAHKNSGREVAAPGSSGILGQSSNQAKAFSEKDLMFIARIQAHRDPFALIVASCCANIYGHEMVKAGLLLGLFGGTPRNGSVVEAQKLASVSQSAESEVDSTASAIVEPVEPFERSSSKLQVRSDPHVLVVGDPGMGKSQMLQAIAGLAPRGVYVCGNTTSSTGLTVTMVRDAVTGDYGLEAGALVLGDQGVCCIDEFDKMSADHQALLEAMEQQRISVAKAGIVSSLSARTSVLAAANPVGGHYNRGKTIQENLKMSEALLSRFDLIFILLDRPDELRDRQLSEHVMSMHDADRRPAWSAPTNGTRSGHDEVAAARAFIADATRGPTQFEPDEDRRGLNAASTQAAHERAKQYAGALEERDSRNAAIDGKLPLDIRLRRAVAAIAPEELVPPILLRKYVAYTRKYCFPALLPDAAQVLQDFYLTLRKKHGSADSTPITTRQLESMIRLAEARAKVELREYVTKSDAEDVVAMMKESLFDAVTDDFGVIDFARASGMSMGKQVKLFVQGLTKAASNRGHSKFSTEELQRFAKDMRLQVPSFPDFLEILNQQSYLLKTGPKEWKLATAGGH